jgi:HAD superfamily hydrolase (TIGR01490 family)
VTPDRHDAAAPLANLAADRATDPGADPAAAAFFDVDNTMMRGASIFHFARGLAARDYFTARDLAVMAWQQVRFRLAGEASSDGIARIRESALSFVAGKDVTQIIQYGEEIYDEIMSHRIFAGTRALAQQHLDEGRRVWLVTATPVELARIIADRLGLTGALGTVAEIEQGVYTGRLAGPPLHGEAKAAAVAALAERESLDLARCSAYSDSVNDLPMLSLVGDPVAVNPDVSLRRLARERGWRTVDFGTGRKAARWAPPVALGVGVGVGVAAGVRVARTR